MDENFELIQEEQPKALPMKWYNFVVKFLMRFDGVINILCGLLAASTLLYLPIAQFVTNEPMDYLYTGNKAFDIVCGVVILAIGVVNFIVCSSMKKFAADALKKYYALLVCQNVFFYIYDILLAFITGAKLDIADVVVFNLVTSVVRVALEIYYFNKRKHLFVN